MLGNKEFLGITHEDGRVRIARLRKTGKSLELAELFVFDLPNSLNSKTGGIEGGTTEAEDVFGLESDLDDLDLSGELGGQSDDLSGDLSGDVGDDFDMTDVEEDEDAQNEMRMADYLKQFGQNKLDIGVHVPFGRTVFQILKGVDLDSMKKKERKEFILEKLRPIYENELNEDQYAWEKAGDNSLLASCNDNYDLLHLVDVAETYYDGKTIIRELLSDESIWMGLARTNYDLSEEDVTGLISIGAKTSRVIFMQGNDILSVLPVITEGENRDSVLNTIFSKILFEFDKGELPKITRLLLVNSSKTSEKAKAFFEKQFDDDVEVDYLMPDPELLSLADDLTLRDQNVSSPVVLQPYLTAIGAAWAASGMNEKEFSTLSLLPDFIEEKQKVFKLEWHGAILLLLIALTPLFLNNIYNDKSSELRSLEQQVQILDTQIEDIRPIATMTEDLMADQQQIQAETDRLLELAEYSQRWSETMRIINHGVDEISNLWIRSMRSDDANLIVNGVALGRVEIPEISNLFTNANIEQVRESEMRERDVYDFSINVNNILQDIDPFLLEMPEATFDPEQIEESITDAGATPINLSEEEVQQQFMENEPPQTSASEPTVAEDQAPEPEEETVSEPEPEVTATQPPSETVDASESSYGLMGPEESLMWGAYTIVIHSLLDSTRAANAEEIIREEGFKTTKWQINREGMSRWWRVGVGQFETISEAVEAMSDLPDPINKDDNYIIRIRDDF